MARSSKSQSFYQFLVTMYKDRETGKTVAEIPTLAIADFGIDSSEALLRLREMVQFHLECLLEEGKPVPEDRGEEEGFYVRVRVPSRAA